MKKFYKSCHMLHAVRPEMRESNKFLVESNKFFKKFKFSDHFINFDSFK